jgi:hypothetical protein
MKRLFIFILCLCVLPLAAQTYIVYIATGDVTVMTNGQSQPLQKGQELNEQSVVSILHGGQVVLLNKTERKLYTIKAEGKGKLSTLLSMQDNKSQDLTEAYVSYISEKIKSDSETNQKNYMQSAGSSYRDADSTLLQTLYLDD